MNCASGSLMCAIRGPIMLIAVGALFAAHQFTSYSFRRTWPVLLILVGLLKLFERLFSGPAHPNQSSGPGGGV